MTLADLLPPPPSALPRHAAARLLAACVAEFEALQTFDDETLTFETGPAEVARMRHLRAAWSRWADDAETALRRIEDDPSVDPEAVRRLLRDHVAHARYVVGVDVDEMRRRYERAQAGEYITREEARRALGLSHCR